MADLPSIVIIDRTHQDPNLLQEVASALQIQAMRDFAQPSPNGWGLAATVRVETARMPLRKSEWPLYLLAEADEPDALGYHDESADNVPILKIFPLLDAADGTPWSVTASHEMVEALADPLLSRCVQAPDGRIWSMETADPCENDVYDIHGLQVSNFVLPAWFEPPKNKAGAKYDFLGKLTKPFSIRPGGYAQYLSSRGWVSVYGPQVRSQRKTRPGRLMRRAARLLPDSETTLPDMVVPDAKNDG